MSFANWNNAYSVKVQRLDDEHQQLFAIINQLHEGMKGGRGKDVLRTVLAELVRYTEQHFRDEEALMRQAAYPELTLHQGQHQDFAAKVARLCTEYEAGASAISIELLEFLKNWLAHHIMGTDHKYSATLNAAGIR